MIQCRCDFGQKRMTHLHTFSRRRTDGRVSCRPSDLIFDAVATVTRCIILALSELTQHKFRSGNSSDDEQPWPQGPEDLLPFGPKDSIAGLELWVARQPQGYIIFKLAGRLARFYSPFGAEVLRNSKFALDWPCQHLEATIASCHEGDSSLLAQLDFFTLPIKAITVFFEDLLFTDLPRFKVMIFLCGDRLKPILTPLATILSSLPSDSESSGAQMMVSLFTSIVNAELDPETGNAMIKLDYNLFTKFDKTTEQKELEASIFLMNETRKLGCCNIQCPSQYGAVHSRLCSKCTLMRFCDEKVNVFSFIPGNTLTRIHHVVSKGCVEICSVAPQGCLCTDLLFERGSWLCRLVTLVDS